MYDFKQTIIAIVRQFIEVLSTNKLLGVECLFRFTSRELINDILSNYENSLGSGQQLGYVESVADHE
jgi:hypothetical protein